MFFKLGDILIPTLVGALTGLLAVSVISSHSNMIYGMVAGMLLAMAAQLFLIPIEMPLLGVFEVMIPSMIAGMLSGMINGMLSAMGILSAFGSSTLGGVLGFFVYLWIQRTNRRLTGDPI